MARQHRIETGFATLAVEESGDHGLPVLMIHGNSSCRGVFRNQMNGRLAEKYRLIAFDLPGHGASGDAPDPSRSYTMAGYAEAAVEVLRQLGVKEAAVFGWSLGGHIGIEMIPRFPGLKGLMITGTPPVALAGAAAGFKPSPHMGLAGQRDFSEIDIDNYAAATCGAPHAPFLRAAVARTDGRARKTMFDAFAAGDGIDQRDTVATSPILLGVVNGDDEPFVNLDYVDSLSYANLWEGHCHRLAGLGHALFWEAPQVFDPILERFLDDAAAQS